MQGNLQEAIDYAKRNPRSDFARQLQMRIQSGAADAEAQNQGVDLSWAGRPSFTETEVVEEPGFGERVSNRFAERGQNVRDIKTRDQSTASKAYQTLGQSAAFFLGDIPFEALKSLTPDVVEEKVKQGFTKLAKTEGVQSAMEKYQSFKDEHPELAGNLEATFNIAAAAPVLKGGQVAGKAITESARSTARTAARVTGEVTEGIKKAGTEAAGGLAEFAESAVAKPIPAQFETALRNTSTRQFDSYADAAQKAAKDLKNPTPLEVAGTRAQEALTLIQDKLSKAGAAKGDFMRIGGAGLTPVKKDILDTAYNRIQSMRNARSLLEGDNKLLSSLENELRRLRDSSTVTANSVDKLVDFMQDNLYTSTRDLSIPVTEQTTGALRSIIGELNSGLKGQLPPAYTRLNDEYSHLIDIRNELNTKLGKEGERGGSLMKRVFSPSDANTKKLFAEVLKETGIDLVNEATIAKYVMEAVGDARQASMLEELALPRMSSSGVLDYVKELVTKRFNTPEAQLQRARNITK